MYTTNDFDPRDRLISSQQKLIEQLVAHIVKLTSPTPMPMFGPIPTPLSEEQEDEMARRAFAGEEGLDLNDPDVREILEAAGALSSDITVAD